MYAEVLKQSFGSHAERSRSEAKLIKVPAAGHAAKVTEPPGASAGQSCSPRELGAWEWRSRRTMPGPALAVRSTLMTNDNFGEALRVFLRDRRVEVKLRGIGLDRLLDDPEVRDPLLNHLRAAALVGFKLNAWDWLGMRFIDTPSAETKLIQSAWNWTSRPLDARSFRTEARNIWGLKFCEAAQLYERGSALPVPTATMFRDRTPQDIQRVRAEPGATLWNQRGGQLVCVEGNIRMHALALGLVRNVLNDADIERWTMWVPQ